MDDSYLGSLLSKKGSRQLTEEELLLLYKEIKEVSESNFWFNFKPRGIQDKVLRAFKTRKGFQIVMCIGPNQIGKTFCILHYIVDFLTRRNEYRQWSEKPMHFGYFSKHRRFQRATIDTALLKYCGDYIKNGLDGRPGIDSQSGAFTFLKFKNDPANGYHGDLLQFETYEMPAKDIEGYVLDAAAMDEAHDKFEHFKYLNQRLVSRNGPILMSELPPEDTESDMYRLIFKHYYEDDKDSFEFIDFAVADINDYAAIHGWDKVNYFRKIYTPEEFDRKIGGKPGKVTDMVYPFSKNKHLIEPFPIPKHWRKDISIDYATSDNKWVKGTGTSKELKKSATMAMFFAIPPPGEEIELHDGRVLVATEEKPLYFAYREYYWTNEGSKRLAQDHALEIVKLFSPGDKFQSILIDCAIDDTAFSEMKKVFDKYKQPFFRKVTVASKTRFSTERKKQLGGHELVRQIIGNDQFYLFNTCPNFLREEENYKIDKNTQEPRRFGDHGMDCRRYYLNSFPTYKDPEYLLLQEDGGSNINYNMDYLSDDFRVSNYLLSNSQNGLRHRI